MKSAPAQKGLYSYYYEKYMAQEVQKKSQEQLKLPDSPLRQKLPNVAESEYEQSGEFDQKIDKIVKWAHNLPSEVV